MALVQDPFAVAEDTVDAPVNEHAKLHVLIIAACLKVLRRRLIVGLRESSSDG
jgi:hypothetical protein